MPEMFYKFPLNENDYKLDSFRLARRIFDSGFMPDFVIPIWRGGAAPFLYVTEAFKRYGIDCEHAPAQGYSYNGVGKQGEVGIRSIDEIISIINGQIPDKNGVNKIYRKILLGDDVFDSGKTMLAFVEKLKKELKHEYKAKIATVYWKPYANKTNIVPDFFVRRFDPITVGGEEKFPWIVFPHEVSDLSDDELRIYYPNVADILLNEPKTKSVH